MLGLTGSTDSRLNTITLVGEPKLISVAESYLKQIDLRKRQVAVKVQILNVDLTNDKIIEPSFSAMLGNTLVISDRGRAYINFASESAEELFEYDEDLVLGLLDTVIESSSAKTLAQPTLLVQEGQEAEVQTGTSVITSVTTTDNGTSTQFEYERENAGLNLKVEVSKIDDNGFVSEH